MIIHIQGDVMLRLIAPVDTNGAEKASKTIALGEHTGHAHVITGDAEVFKIDGKMVVVVGKDGGKLEHLDTIQKRKGDHDEIVLDEGQSYEVILQNEYNPYSKIYERVID